jgi:hypothetical protein
MFVFGSLLAALAFQVWLAVVGTIFLLRKSQPNVSFARSGPPYLTVALCSIAAAALAIGLGFLRPMFVPRYLTPFLPGVFLGVALLANRLSKRWHLAAISLVAIFFITSLVWGVSPLRGENDFNFEAASRALMASHPKRLVFMWDTPLGVDRSSFAGVGGFFFTRAGEEVAVDVVSVAKGQDPNRVLLDHAAPPRSVILWFYDSKVPGTAAIRFPPAISKVNPRWKCKDFGKGQFGVLACSREGIS